MQPQYFQNEYTTMKMENGILRVVYVPFLEVTYEVARKCVEDRIAFSKMLAIPYPMLSDGRNIKSMDIKARQYLSQPEALRYLTAGAFLINNYIQKFIGNTWFLVNKQPLPAKLFTAEDEALRWLEYYKHVN